MGDQVLASEVMQPLDRTSMIKEIHPNALGLLPLFWGYRSFENDKSAPVMIKTRLRFLADNHACGME